MTAHGRQQPSAVRALPRAPPPDVVWAASVRAKLNSGRFPNPLPVEFGREPNPPSHAKRQSPPISVLTASKHVHVSKSLPVVFRMARGDAKDKDADEDYPNEVLLAPCTACMQTRLKCAINQNSRSTGGGAPSERGVQNMEEEHAVPVRPGHHARAGVALPDCAVAAGAQRARSTLFVLALGGARAPRCGAQSRQEVAGKEYSTQKLVLGTHTSENEQNYLMIAEVQARRRKRAASKRTAPRGKR